MIMHVLTMPAFLTLLPIAITTPIPGPKTIVRPITSDIAPMTNDPPSFHARSAAINDISTSVHDLRHPNFKNAPSEKPDTATNTRGAREKREDENLLEKLKEWSGFNALEDNLEGAK